MPNDLERFWNEIVSKIPEILLAILILIVGYFVALALKQIVVSALKRVGFNKRILDSPEGNIARRISKDPAKLIGNLVYWLVWIFVISFSILALGIPILNNIIYDIYGYLPNILASILILAIAIAIAAGIASLSHKLIGDTPTGRIVAATIPPVVMTIAIFMILVQLGIASPIVIITYAALIGALALGFALAFGLGGRDVAAKLLEDAYKKGQENIDQVRKDMQTARERGKREIEDAKKEYGEE